MFLKRSFVLGVLWFACGVVFLLRALLGGGVVSIPLLLLAAVCLGGGAAECVLSVRCRQTAALALLILLAAQFSFCALFALSIIFTPLPCSPSPARQSGFSTTGFSRSETAPPRMRQACRNKPSFRNKSRQNTPRRNGRGAVLSAISVYA